MLAMIIALAQINPLIGDLEGNGLAILRCIDDARAAGADLVVLPELAMTGYPPKDLLLKPAFVDGNIAAVRRLAEATRGGPAALVGYVGRNESPVGRSLRNAVALLQDGRLVESFCKSLLPTHDVFDELRYFEPAERCGVARIAVGGGGAPAEDPSPTPGRGGAPKHASGRSDDRPPRGAEATSAGDSRPPRGADATGELVRVGVTVCEDLWNDDDLLDRRLYHRNPIEELRAAGVGLIVNASASPFAVGKQSLREKLMGAHALAAGAPLAYVNQIGGNDELLFDGASCVYDAGGRVVARARTFEEDLLVVDLDDLATARVEAYPSEIESVRRGLVTGTRDYVRKCGFKQVVVGLSGGIDSALTAVIAVEALGRENVHGVAMPSRFSSDHSLADARSLADNLGIDYRVIPIKGIHDAVERELSPHFEGRPPDITEENIQARARGNVLMALSNKFAWLLLTTGNKSELAVGYCTLYGDMCGGLAVISDVPKTMVYDLARHINATAGRPVIPESSITKPPSAELRPDQHDQQSLPPYNELDAILHAYVEKERSISQIAAEGFDEALVRDIARKVDRNEYKRKQAATGLKVTSRAFGVGRRMPIAARFS